MISRNELKSLIRSAERFGARVTVKQHVDTEGRFVFDSALVRGAAGIGPHPFTSMIGLGEQLRAFLGRQAAVQAGVVLV